MSVANIHDQALRYHNLRQGDKEYISDFKIRFDHQVKSNQAVGIPEIGEPLRAMDFIGKHDIKRYNGMLTRMRNCACQNLPGSSTIEYNAKENRFTVQPKGSKTIYSFCRKKINSSESKFYVCYMRSMVDIIHTEHPIALVATVADNLVRYTKREVIGAKKVRELLAKLGYPSVENAIGMLRDGSGFDVTPYDF